MAKFNYKMCFSPYGNSLRAKKSIANEVYKELKKIDFTDSDMAVRVFAREYVNQRIGIYK